MPWLLAQSLCAHATATELEAELGAELEAGLDTELEAGLDAVLEVGLDAESVQCLAPWAPSRRRPNLGLFPVSQ